MGCGSSKGQPSTKWDGLDAKIPYQKTSDALKRRTDLWKKFDRRGQNNLSKEDCLEGCKQHLQIHTLFPKELPMASDAAFNSSHNLRVKPDHTDNVDPQEWRIYLQFLRDNIELATMFTEIDKNKTPGRITKEELTAAIPNLKKWGAPVNNNNVDKVFTTIDKDKKGTIDFEEFADWALKNRLDREKDDKVEAVKDAADNKGREQRAALFKTMKEKLPTGQTENDAKKRETLFQKFDTKKKGVLTENDCLDGCKKQLELDKLVPANQLTAVNKASFNKAKVLSPAVSANNKTNGTVDPNEFRFYLVSLRDHAELAAMFEEMDASKDGKVTKDEFKKVLPRLDKWGVRVADPEKEFAAIDKDKKGTLDFYEFADWAGKRNLDIEKEDAEKMLAYKQNQEAIENMTKPKREEPILVNNLIPVPTASENPPASQNPTAQPPSSQDVVQPFNEIENPPASQNPPAQPPSSQDVVQPNAAAEKRRDALRMLQIQLPIDKTKSEQRKRDILFDMFDEKKNRVLSETECLNGCKKYLHIADLTDHPEVPNSYAYNSCKDYKVTGEHPGIDRCEFRIYLKALSSYFELNTMFDSVDANNDNKISKKEFIEATPQLKQWGARIKDPNETFDHLDKNKNGSIDFPEFAKWASRLKLDMERDCAVQQIEAAKAAELDATKGEKTQAEKEAAKKEAERRRMLWSEIQLRLPREKIKNENEKRSELFKQFDVKGTGQLDLEDVERGSREILKLHEFYEPISPIIKRAFNHASIAGTLAQGLQVDVPESDTLERAEFRLFLVFIYDFLELFVKFEEMDFAIDRRIPYPIFERCLQIIEGWGVKLDDPKRAFDEEIDVYGLQTVSFDEFADWAIYKHMEAQKVPIRRPSQDVLERRRSSHSMN